MSFLKKHWLGVTVASILIIMFGIMFTTALGESPVVDEIAHIPSGFSYMTTGDYRLNPEHPPLIKDLSAIPLIIWGAKFPYGYWASNNPVVNNEWNVGWKFIYGMGNNPNTLMILARLPMILLSLVFAYFVFRWAKELFGKKAGVLALILYAFNETIIAHSGFVTTDIGVSFAIFLSMYVLYKFLKNPRKLTLILSGLTFGFALLTKFSGPILAPAYIVIFIMLLLKRGEKEEEGFLARINDKRLKKRFTSGFLSFLMIGFLGFFCMWLVYIPHTMFMPAKVQQTLIAQSLPQTSGLGKTAKDILTPMSNNFLTKPLAQWFLGFVMVASHVEGGHDSFFMGQVGNQGWWLYYPVALAIKTPIPIFIFILLIIFFWRSFKHKDWFTETYFWIIPAILLFMGIQGKIDLGIRYMLPMFAFVFIFISRAGEKIDLKALLKKISIMQIIIILLVVWYIVEAILIYPYYMSYYNEFIGGYQNGYKYLTDSNTDWGQDLKYLNTWVDQHHIKKIYVDAFPGSFSEAYYLNGKAIPWHVTEGRPKGWFAVSVTFYQSSKLYTKSNGTDYSWLNSIKPVKNLGGAILIYDLK
jgi:hypothetical protein